MSREIKFRAYGESIVGEYKGERKFYYWKMGDNFDEELLVEDMANIEFDTVNEWTGLKDKNGVEIFEGDIMDFSYLKKEEDEPTCGVVRYEEGGFFLTNIRKIFSECIISWQREAWHEYEVIGNIYENKELLNED